MRRPRRGSFEDRFPRGEIAPWDQILAGIIYEQPTDPAQRVEPLPRAFCVFFILLSSLVIYGAIISLFGLFN